MSNVIPFPTKARAASDYFDEFVLELTSTPQDTLTVYALLECYADGTRKLLMAHDDIESMSMIVDRVQELHPHREFLIQPVEISTDID